MPTRLGRTVLGFRFFDRLAVYCDARSDAVKKRIGRLILMVFSVSVTACASTAGEPMWIEEEHWYRQGGSVGPDRPPFASRGECLGSSWGGDVGDFVVYRFTLPHDLPDTRLLLRYAQKGDTVYRVIVDGNVVQEQAVIEPTGG